MVEIDQGSIFVEMGNFGAFFRKDSLHRSGAQKMAEEGDLKFSNLFGQLDELAQEMDIPQDLTTGDMYADPELVSKLRECLRIMQGRGYSWEDLTS